MNPTRRSYEAHVLLVPLGAKAVEAQGTFAARGLAGVMTVLGVKVNTTIQSLRRFSILGFLRRRTERSAVTDLLDRLEITTPSLEQPVEFLSGGNQQKVSVSRSFLK